MLAFRDPLLDRALEVLVVVQRAHRALVALDLAAVEARDGRIVAERLREALLELSEAVRTERETMLHRLASDLQGVGNVVEIDSGKSVECGQQTLYLRLQPFLSPR